MLSGVSTQIGFTPEEIKNPGDDQFMEAAGMLPSSLPEIAIASKGLRDVDPLMWVPGATIRHQFQGIKYDVVNRLREAGVGPEEQLRGYKNVSQTGAAAERATETNGAPPDQNMAMVTYKLLQQNGVVPTIDDSVLAELVQAYSMAPALRGADFDTLSEGTQSAGIGYLIGQILSGGGPAGMAGGAQFFGSAIARQQQMFDLEYKNAVAKHQGKVEGLRTSLETKLGEYQAKMTLAGQVAPTLINAENQTAMQDRELEFKRWETTFTTAAQTSIANAQNETEKSRIRLNSQQAFAAMMASTPIKDGYKVMFDKLGAAQQKALVENLGEAAHTALYNGELNSLNYIIKQGEADVASGENARLNEKTRLEGVMTAAQVALMKIQGQVAKGELAARNAELAQRIKEHSESGGAKPWSVADINKAVATLAANAEMYDKQLPELEAAFKLYELNGEGWKAAGIQRLDAASQGQIMEAVTRLKTMTASEMQAFGLTVESSPKQIADAIRATLGNKDAKGLTVVDNIAANLSSYWKAKSGRDSFAKSAKSFSDMLGGAVAGGGAQDPKE